MQTLPYLFSAKSIGQRTITVNRILGKVLQVREMLVSDQKTWPSDVNIFAS